MQHTLSDFARDERGVTAVEYGLLSGLLVVVFIIALTNYKDELVRLINYAATQFAQGVGSSP